MAAVAATRIVMAPHVVWVGSVPAALCASEAAVREVFGEYGKLQAVRIHHNLVDMSANGFMFLEFASKRAAQRAVDAVASDSNGDMRAEHALKRGDPAVDPGEPGGDEDLHDLLLGRRSVSAGLAFGSQRAEAEDDDDAVLHSLSQHSFGSQRKRHKRRKLRRPDSQ